MEEQTISVEHCAPTTASRIFWSGVFLAHAAFAAAWWGNKPHGFALAHPKFWVNEVLPPVALATALAATGFLWSRRGRPSWFVPVIPGGWAGAAVGVLLTFPISGRRLCLVAVLGTLVFAAAAWRLLRRSGAPSWAARVVFAAGALLGGVLPLSQRAPAADTRPLGVPPAPAGPWLGQFPNDLHLGDGVSVSTEDGSVRLGREPVLVYVEPLLSFYSHSPDRGWAWGALMPRRHYRGPGRRCVGVREILSETPAPAVTQPRVALRFLDHGESVLEVTRAACNAVEIESRTQIGAPVYTHQNTFAAFNLSGVDTTALDISFSPCPDARVRAFPFDYPYGRPIRFAYLDAAGVFRVAEASSGEKGPFREIASGPLAPAEPVVVTVYERDRPLLRIRIYDWAAQVSTSPSPTAGWGVPANSIGFGITGRSRRNLAPGLRMFVSLAETGMGSGFDSVGNSPGAYRSRLTIEWLAEGEAAPPATGAVADE